jgi:hypothetical protein
MNKIKNNPRGTIDSGTEQIHATCNPDKIRFQPFPHGALEIFRRENRDPMDLHALMEAANMNHSSVGKSRTLPAPAFISLMESSE